MPPKPKPTSAKPEDNAKKHVRKPSKSPAPTSKKEETKQTPKTKKPSEVPSTKKPSAKPEEKKKKPKNEEKSKSKTRDEGKAKPSKKKSISSSPISKKRDGEASDQSESPTIMTINSRSERHSTYNKAGEVGNLNNVQEKIIDKAYQKLQQFNDQEGYNLHKVNAERSEISMTPPVITSSQIITDYNRPSTASGIRSSLKQEVMQTRVPSQIQVPQNGYYQPNGGGNHQLVSPSQRIQEHDIEETYSMGGGEVDMLGGVGSPITHADSQQQPIGMDENEVTRLFDQIQDLQNKNIELKKKCHKYKKQVSLIPELRGELVNLREHLSLVEKGYTASKRQFNNQLEEGEDVSFGKNQEQVGMQGPVSRTSLSMEQLRKILDKLEEKNYSLVKENIDLKGQISELKEQVIKRNNFIEGLRSDSKMMIMDLKYLHQKLNRGQEITNVREPELTGKFIVSQIDHLIDEKLATIKDAYDRQIQHDQRATGLKDQILNLQSMIDRNQDVVVHQSARLQTLEDINKNLKHDVTVKSEVERQLDGFKTSVKNRLLKIKANFDSEEGSRNVYQDVSIDHLLDWVTDRTYQLVSTDRSMRAHIDQLTGELHKKTSDLDVIRSGNLLPRSLPSEERARLQEHISKLEEMLDNRNRLAATTGSFGGSLDNRQRNDPAEGDVIEAFLYQMLHKVKSLIFQKGYLKLQNSSLQEKVSKLEFELRAIAPYRTINRPRSILKLRKCVQSVIFIQRLKKANILQFGEVMIKKRAADRLSNNWNTFKAIWEPETRQSVRVHSTAERLLKKFTPYPLIFKEIPRRFYDNDCLDVIDALRVKFGDLTHKAHESKYQADQQAQRMRTLEQDRYYQVQPRADQVQEDIISRQRAAIRDLEAKLEELRVMYEQKIRYLKQDLDMKKHQIDNMRSLIQVTEQNSVEEEQADAGPKFKPIRTGGGFLLPSMHPEAYAEQLKQQQQLEIQENKH